MDDHACRRFFTEPEQTFHRRSEALRTFFVEGWSVEATAAQFGYRVAALKSLISRFRAGCTKGQAPPFSSGRTGTPRGPATLRRRAWTRTRRPCRPPPIEPGPGPATAYAPGRRVLVSAAFGAVAVRSTRPAGWLSRLEDGSCQPCATFLVDPQAPGQGTPQPHRRLQLRPCVGPVRRVEHPAQEVVCHRVFLPHPTRAPREVATRLNISRPWKSAINSSVAQRLGSS
jgi:hypothetical protein